MVTSSITSSFCPAISTNTKVLALETSLHQSSLDFKELLIDMEKLHIESESHKAKYQKQMEKCERNSCSGALNLKKALETKENIIQLVASILTTLNETKNWNLLDDIFKVIFDESSTLPSMAFLKSQDVQKPIVKEELVSPKKEMASPNKDLSFRDESISEIEGTPTGRTSPIIHSKKLKNSMVTLEKKKCPDSWPTPESKAIKLIYPTPTRSKSTGRMRQSKLNVVQVKSSTVIDITCSPEFSGGSRGNAKDTNSNVQPLIKKESFDNDDTILPSPTSGATPFTLFKSPMKFKKPPLSLKNKTEKSNNTSIRFDQDVENKNIKIERNNTNNEESNKLNSSETYTQDDSINILNPNRLLPTTFIKNSPLKQEHNDTTFFDTQASVSLLQNMEKIEVIHIDDQQLSPNKRPLAENINVTNKLEDDELQASMSLLQRDAKLKIPDVNNVKRKLAVFEVDEERTPKTRAEKRQLPGWACEDCINFFGELYKDDPEFMKKKINECSHHRGVTNPERAKTPPGFWNPRWNVPDDTEEFNRRNNVS